MWYLIWAFCPFVVSAGVRQKYEKKLRTNFEQISSFLVTYKEGVERNSRKNTKKKLRNNFGQISSVLVTYREGVERNLGEIRKKIYATISDKSRPFWSPTERALKVIQEK